MQAWGNQNFISQAGIVFVVLNVLILKSPDKLVCQVTILVRPWPDLPGWLPQPCNVWYIDMYIQSNYFIH